MCSANRSASTWWLARQEQQLQVGVAADQSLAPDTLQVQLVARQPCTYIVCQLPWPALL